MRKGGIGGAKTTKSGLEFERKTDLKTLFEVIRGYSVKGDDLFYDGKLVAKIYKKYDFYKHLKKEFGIDWRKHISSILLPDEVIFVLRNKTLYVIEKKFQEVKGSVDEKLQTCDFKKKQYEKLVSGLGWTVKYVYLLCDWFDDPKYSDVLEYIKSVGCDYFFKKIPFEYLGLPEPSS